MLLIGLHGKKRSGKDTVCDFIKDWGATNNYPVQREAFADRLKTSAAHAIGIFEDELAWANEFKETGQILVQSKDVRHGGFAHTTVSGREYLQYYGTEAHREVFASDFWVDAVLPQPTGDKVEDNIALDARYPDASVLIVTDVRFPNEAERIQRLGGEVWQVIRKTPGFDQTVDNHASEKPLPVDLVDRTITNNSDLDHLRDVATALIERKFYTWH